MRKFKVVKMIIFMVVVFYLCLTLLSCEHNSRQTKYNPFDNEQYRQRYAEVILLIATRLQRQRCMSAVVEQTSDIDYCSNCHDKIKR